MRDLDEQETSRTGGARLRLVDGTAERDVVAGQATATGIPGVKRGRSGTEAIVILLARLQYKKEIVMTKQKNFRRFCDTKSDDA